MGEKRGQTGKLKYDFNTVWVCEIQYEEGGRWYRALERDFRSFNGARRITKPNPAVLGNPYVGSVTFDYEGPYYYWNTNTEYNPDDHEKGKIVYGADQKRIPATPTSVAGL